MMGAGTHGAPAWVDLATPDIEAAIAFYSQLFGWSIEPWTPAVLGGYLASVGDREVAGLRRRGPDQRSKPAFWTAYFSVDDLEESVTATQRAGGAVVEPPIDLAGGVRAVAVVDPTGAKLALIAGRSETRTYVARDIGAVPWVQLLTRHPERATAFYAALFGWEAVGEVDAGTTYAVFTRGDDQIAGMMKMPDTVPARAPAQWGVYFAVSDSFAAERQAVEFGGRVLRPTMTFENDRVVVLADPNGASFRVIEFTRGGSP